MDKKKVKELIEKTIRFTKVTDDDYIQGNVKSHIINTLQVALKELSRSDWVSVEDGLPPCEEEVLVRDINAKGDWSKPWICYRSKNECYRHITDKHKFVTTRLGEITHWKPIEKLEE